VVDNHHLSREFCFVDFATALKFVHCVGTMAEEQCHHPDISLTWGKAGVEVWTHKIGGLTESDFIFAAKTDEIWKTAEGKAGAGKLGPEGAGSDFSCGRRPLHPRWLASLDSPAVPRAAVKFIPQLLTPGASHIRQTGAPRTIRRAAGRPPRDRNAALGRPRAGCPLADSEKREAPFRFTLAFRSRRCTRQNSPYCQ